RENERARAMGKRIIAGDRAKRGAEAVDCPSRDLVRSGHPSLPNFALGETCAAERTENGHDAGTGVDALGHDPSVTGAEIGEKTIVEFVLRSESDVAALGRLDVISAGKAVEMRNPEASAGADDGDRAFVRKRLFRTANMDEIFGRRLRDGMCDRA